MLAHLVNILFPKVCCGCKTFLLSNEKVICTACRHEMPLTGFYSYPDNEAHKKFYGRILVDHVSAFLYYHKKGIVQELIHALKYRGHEEIGTVLGEWYAVHLLELEWVARVDYIIPVPLHRKKLRKRGYNQVTTFSKALSDKLKIPLLEDLLVRKIDSETQSRKSFLKRTEINEAFFDAHFDQSLHNRHFLLVDDVLTTGATLEACGRKLLRIPGAQLSIVTIAFSHS